MALTLRLVKGAALTYSELDNNFIYLNSALTASTAAGLITASASSNTIIFTKGDGSTFPITINTGSGGGGTPGGSDRQIQFNSGSRFSGSAAFRYVYVSQSLEQGSGVVATGNFSHAEGYQTVASSLYSHAEGDRTNATGYASHAEGDQTDAIGYASHAEGRSTQAIGGLSHAEGGSTQTIGEYSHAEGYSTQAIGESSHAEGESTIASGLYSHAEG